MNVIAIDLNSDMLIAKGTVISVEDTAHGSELYVIRPLDSFIPVRVDTLHTDVREVLAFVA